MNNNRFLCVTIKEYCFGIPLTILKPKTMNLSKIWASYYPVILAFLSFLYSVSLWFTGNKLEGIFVGIWVPSILGFSVAIRQIRRDTNQENKSWWTIQSCLLSDSPFLLPICGVTSLWFTERIRNRKKKWKIILRINNLGFFPHKKLTKGLAFE